MSTALPSTAGVAAGRTTTAGRTRITAGALTQVVSAVTGDALGVPAKRVDVVLSDRAGALDVLARSPMQVVSIATMRETPSALARSGGSLLDRCAVAEQEIRARVETMTGYTIRAVTIRVTGVHVEKERRVR